MSAKRGIHTKDTFGGVSLGVRVRAKRQTQMKVRFRQSIFVIRREKI